MSANSGMEDLAAEIKEVKMLLILQLLKSGVPQKHIAQMLGFSPAKMSMMLPKGLAKAIGKSVTEEE